MSIHRVIEIYDTTLRDGAQAENVHFTVAEKLRLLSIISELGIDLIEAGWPGTNDTDTELFEQAKQLSLGNSRLVAFGSTCRPRFWPDTDSLYDALLRAETPVVTIFGKAWDFHVTHCLSLSIEHHLDIVRDSVSYLKRRRDRVIFDAEHFFDGYARNPNFAMKVLAAAVEGGADTLVLCDTNGGSVTQDVELAVACVARAFPQATIGIHSHNDAELAVSNSLAAVQSGATHVQGTINGIGERCGNANLCSLLPNLLLKLGYTTAYIGLHQLSELTKLSRLLYDMLDREPLPNQPFVGKSAFSHKAGVHVSAVRRYANSYEHVPPEWVGNTRHLIVSDQAGKACLDSMLERLGLSHVTGQIRTELLRMIKERAHRIPQEDLAEASLEILIRRQCEALPDYFMIRDVTICSSESPNSLESPCEATTLLKVDGSVKQSTGNGNDLISALDQMLRTALIDCYPEVSAVRISEVRYRNRRTRQGTLPLVVVLLTLTDGDQHWHTVGSDSNIVRAATQALTDAYVYKIIGTAKASQIEGMGLPEIHPGALSFEATTGRAYFPAEKQSL